MKYAKRLDEAGPAVFDPEAVQGSVSFEAREGVRSQREVVPDRQRRMVGELRGLAD